MKRNLRTDDSERERGATGESDAGWNVAWALEGRTTELIERWERRLGRGAWDGFDERDPAEPTSVVVSWIVFSMASGPALDADTAEALGTIARRWRNAGRPVGEAMVRFGVLSRVLHEEMRAVLAALGGQVDVGLAARVGERLSDAVMMVRLALAEAYCEAEENQFNTFASTLIHEIRNPLGAALAALETLDILGERGQLDAGNGYPRTLKRIEQAICLASEKVSAVEGLTRPPGEEQPLAPLERVVSEVLAEFRQDAGAVDLAYQGDMPNILVPGAAVLLTLQNLVRNAITYVDPSEPAPFVHITCEREDDARCWLLRVSDNGIGIAPADQDAIFEQFRRGPGAPGGGLGLGLSIVKAAAGRLDGDVTVESRPGVGSTFTVTLPVGRVKANASRNVEPPGTEAADWLAGCTIRSPGRQTLDRPQ